MKVLIAGGGIGGLSLANCLQRVGIDYHILEAAPQWLSAGYAIGLGFNALNTIRKINPALEQRIVNTGVPSSFGLGQGGTGKLFFVNPEPLTQDKGRYGKSRWVPMTRPGLQQALLKDIPEDNISLNSRVAGFKQNDQGVQVFLENGNVMEGDVLVGADGIKSRIRNELHNQYPQHLGPAPAVKFTNYTLFGGQNLIDSSFPHFEKIISNFSWYFEDGKLFTVLPVAKVGEKYHIFWSVGYHTDTPQGQFTTENKDIQDFLHKQTTKFSKELGIAHMINESLKYVVWDIYELDRTKENNKHWGYGNVTLLGDAAHAVTPWAGQGAGISIEDAFDLTHRLLRNSDVSQAIKEYEAQRIPRAEYIRNFAQTNMKVFDCYHNPILMAILKVVYLVANNKYLFDVANSKIFDYDFPKEPLPVKQ